MLWFQSEDLRKSHSVGLGQYYVLQLCVGKNQIQTLYKQKWLEWYISIAPVTDILKEKIYSSWNENFTWQDSKKL